MTSRELRIAFAEEAANIKSVPSRSTVANTDFAEAVRASEIKEFMYELRGLARSLLACEKDAHSIAPTMLVHTAFFRNTIKDNQWHDVTWASRRHFFADMVQAMRRSLIDRVRRYRAARRPKLLFFRPEEMPVSFSTDLESKPEILELLDEALECLSQSKPELVRMVSYHYYIGLTSCEIGRLLEISEKTVDRNLKIARILLAEIMDDLAGNSRETH